jgi:uncharacterized RDD family membrane protein YckC
MIIINNKGKNLSKRYYANILDYVIVIVLTALYIWAAGDPDDHGTYHVRGFKALAMPLVWFIYFPVCEAIWGHTLGKKALHLHVINLKGEPPSIIQAFFRRMLDIVEMMFFGIPALLAINVYDKNQRLGDMIAGTTVIRTDATCRHCCTELELSPKEAIHHAFTCPACKQLN